MRAAPALSPGSRRGHRTTAAADDDLCPGQHGVTGASPRDGQPRSEQTGTAPGAEPRAAQHGTRYAEPRRDRGRRGPHDAWAPQPGGPARGRSLRSRARRPLAPRRPSAAAPPPRSAERPRDSRRRAILPAGGAPRRAAARTSPPAGRALPVRSRTAGGASSRWSWPRAAAPRSQREESGRRRRPPGVPPALGGSGFSWRSDAGARAPLRRTPGREFAGCTPPPSPVAASQARESSLHFTGGEAPDPQRGFASAALNRPQRTTLRAPARSQSPGVPAREPGDPPPAACSLGPRAPQPLRRQVRATASAPRGKAAASATPGAWEHLQRRGASPGSSGSSAPSRPPGLVNTLSE